MNVTVWYEDSDYVAICDRYPSVSGIGETPEQATEELKTAIELIENEQ